MAAPPSITLLDIGVTIHPQGQYFQKGDIVSMTDVDGGTFYAQLRGFLTDQYCEKSAVLTWLLPTTNSPPPDEVCNVQAGRPIIRKVLKIRIWVVPPVFLGSR